MSALAPVIIPISSHGRTIGVNPAARAKATQSVPRTGRKSRPGRLMRAGRTTLLARFGH